MKEYFRLPSFVLSVIYTEFCIQMVNAAFMYLLPVFMAMQGLTNKEISLEITNRFAGVFLLAFPLGIWCKKYQHGKLFYISSVLVPLLAIAIVWCIAQKYFRLSSFLLFLWGASFSFMQVPVIPYLLKFTPPRLSTHAISLSFSTWSWGSILSSILIFSLHKLNPRLFDEKNLMIVISLLALSGFVILLMVPPASYIKQNNPVGNREHISFRQEDVFILSDALLPTLIIAIGAGFTIPLISLFFFKVHHMPAAEFTLYSFLASILVSVTSIMVPLIKKNFRYRTVVPLTQSMAVLFLVLLAYTEDFHTYAFALPLATVSFLFRQPLMNMAGPITTEVVMDYVGENRRSMASAFTSAIWSGSYVFSGLIAAQLFALGLSFRQIFLITALLYAFGIWLYFRLLIKHENKK